MIRFGAQSRCRRDWTTEDVSRPSDRPCSPPTLKVLNQPFRHAEVERLAHEREAIGGEMAARSGLSRGRMNAAERRHSLIFPREHGAWGILLVPLVTGASVGLLAGGCAWPLAPLSIAVFALFLLRTPVESWMGTTPVRARTHNEVALVRNAALALAVVSLTALIRLFWGGRNPSLLWIGAAAGAAFIAQTVVKRAGRSARTAAQMVGAAGLTLVAPGACYVVTGQLGGVAWSLWIANLLFAINQIHFVQLRIRAAHPTKRSEKLAAGRGFLAGQIILMVLLAAACAGHLFRAYAAMAFLPILFRGFAWFVAEPQPLAIRTLGRRELIHAGAFGVLLVVGLQLP
jgi:hypothetical protein